MKTTRSVSGRRTLLFVIALGCWQTALAQNAAPAWVARYAPTGSYWDAGRDIAVDAVGNVIVVGDSTGPDGSTDITTLKYNAKKREGQL